MWLIYKLSRPILPLSSALTAWVIARACGAETNTAIVAAIAIALSTQGASLYHYGGANWMYRRKCEWLKFSNPWILMVGGLITFGVSAAIAAQWLPKPCALICLFNMVAVVAYSTKLSSHWKTKNITMAAVCATPVVIGWQAGQINHPIVPWALGIAALAHLSREIVKDIQDILANEGKRVTLPMVLGDRVEGPKRAAQLAGGLLAPAVVFPLYMMRFTHTAFQESLIALAVAVLVATAGWLIFRKEPGKSKTAITAALLFTIVAFL